jgi:hypothetical protein
MKNLGYNKRRKNEKEGFYRRARDEVINATRQNVESNIQKAELPTQRVYIISSETMYDMVTGEGDVESQIIDEARLMRDILEIAEERLRRIDSPDTEPLEHSSIEERKIVAANAALGALSLNDPASSS